MSDLLRPEVLFVSVILPICIAIRAWILVWFHNRWVDRDIARERAEKRKLEADRRRLKHRRLHYWPSRPPAAAPRRP